MNSLDLTEEKMKRMNEVENNALIIVDDVLKDQRTVDDTAKIAMKTLNMVAKNRQTMTAREGYRFNMAFSVANEKELRRYIIATQPEIKKYLKA